MKESLNILVIENNIENQMDFRKAFNLKEYRCNYEISSSINMAVNLMRKKPYDSVIVDFALFRNSRNPIPNTFQTVPLIIISLPEDLDKATHYFKHLTCSFIVRDPDKLYLKFLSFNIKKSVTLNQAIENNKKIERKLKISNDRYETLLETSGIPIILLDENYKIQYVNSEFAFFSGYSKSKLETTKNWLDFVPESDKLRMKTYIGSIKHEQLSFDTDHNFPNEFIFIDKKGQEKNIIVNIGLFSDNKSTLISLFDITRIKKTEKEKNLLINRLQKALEKVKTLSGLIPICSNCKKIRDDKGYWTQVEHYIAQHSDVDFSHSICPDCLQKYYPKVYEKMIKEGKLDDKIPE